MDDERILLDARLDAKTGKLTNTTFSGAHRWRWEHTHMVYVVDETHFIVNSTQHVCFFRLANDVAMEDVISRYDPSIVRFGYLTTVDGKKFSLDVANFTIKFGDRTVPVREETNVVVRRFYNSLDVFYNGSDGARRSIRLDFDDSPSSFIVRHAILALGAQEGF